MDVLAILDDALRRTGLSDTAASRLAVGNPSLIKNMRAQSSGRKRYNIDAVAKLAEVLDLELYLGPKRPMDGITAGEDPVFDRLRDALNLPENASTASVERSALEAINATTEHTIVTRLDRIDERLDYALQKTIDQEDDRVAMPLYDIRAAAGDGAAVEFEQVDAWLYFRRDWLLKNSLTIGQCGLVRVTGDSMEPTLVADDVILVDFTSRDPMHSRIYLVRDGDDLQVKRILAEPDAGLVLHSDNTTYEPRPLTDGSVIIGRVTWSGRTFANAPEALRVVR